VCARTRDRLEAIEQILDEILRMFAARRESNERIRESERGARIGGKRRVGHARGRTDERPDAAAAFSERAQPPRRHERRDLLDRAVELERHHAAEPRHLPSGDLVSWMAWKTWVIHTFDERMTVERAGERLRIFRVALHSQFERLESTECQPAV